MKYAKIIHGTGGRPRQREQDLIDAYGGIGDPMLANKINAIWQYNPSGPGYRYTSYMRFGLPNPLTLRR